MQFFQWSTDYQLYKKETPKKDQQSYEEYYKWRLDELEKFGYPHRLIVEDHWVKSGKPYYNVHPKFISKLCKTNLESIPSKMFKMPNDLDSVLISFSQPHEEFTLTEELHTDDNSNLIVGTFVRGVMMNKNSIGDVIFIVEFSERNKDNQPYYVLLSITPKEGVSMQNSIEIAKVLRRGKSYENVIANVLRTAVTIGFLSSNPSICEADVLNEDKYSFQRSTKDQRELIAEKARKKGKFGFNVGTDLMFIGERQFQQQKNSEETGRELEYAHIRAGHPHAVRYGEKKKMVKIVWYVPTTVRSDLPFKETPT